MDIEFETKTTELLNSSGSQEMHLHNGMFNLLGTIYMAKASQVISIAPLVTVRQIKGNVMRRKITLFQTDMTFTEKELN